MDLLSVASKSGFVCTNRGAQAFIIDTDSQQSTQNQTVSKDRIANTNQQANVGFEDSSGIE